MRDRVDCDETLERNDDKRLAGELPAHQASFGMIRPKRAGINW